VDDERFARARASSLASHGAGNALIRARLSTAGVARELADAAIDAVESEDVRAGRIVASRGASPKTARYLHAQGFSEDAVSAAIAVGYDRELR
jgi:SOS response regulatory protein OraA/RecX